MLNFETKRIVDVHNLNNLIYETYNIPYNFQQQEGCRERGIYHVFVDTTPRDMDNDRIVYLDEINFHLEGYTSIDDSDRDDYLEDIEGTMFMKEWLNEDVYSLENSGLNFKREKYPSVNVILNDLYLRGLIAEGGEYLIDVNW